PTWLAHYYQRSDTVPAIQVPLCTRVLHVVAAGFGPRQSVDCESGVGVGLASLVNRLAWISRCCASTKRWPKSIVSDAKCGEDRGGTRQNNLREYTMSSMVTAQTRPTSTA